MKTAWMKSGAFLALDRDGNGRIDNGTELLGSSFDLRAGDGFEALALLDRPGEGGNGNGLVESGDLMWSALRIWIDRNSDGVSQPDELMTLEAAGIKALEINGRQPCGKVVDENGNDLSLRASFLREDGTRGLMVDVYFRASL
jgi:hypothetical protein